MTDYEQARQQLAQVLHDEAIKVQETREKKGIKPRDSDFPVANAFKLLAAFGFNHEDALTTEVSHVEIAEITNQIAQRTGTLQSVIYYNPSSRLFIATVP